MIHTLEVSSGSRSIAHALRDFLFLNKRRISGSYSSGSRMPSLWTLVRFPSTESRPLLSSSSSSSFFAPAGRAPGSSTFLRSAWADCCSRPRFTGTTAASNKSALSGGNSGSTATFLPPEPTRPLTSLFLAAATAASSFATITLCTSLHRRCPVPSTRSALPPSVSLAYSRWTGRMTDLYLLVVGRPCLEQRFAYVVDVATHIRTAY